MTTRAIAALGTAQCVNWGVLYYAFGVLVLPLERELGAPAWIVTGAFSLALLTSAIVAPVVGRLADRDRGPLLLQAGGLCGAALLAAWTLAPGVPALYVVWAGLGLCMAATLYEPAFAIVARAIAEPAQRLRAIAAITLFGGLASTIFFPATTFFLALTGGWRGAVLVLAAVLAISTVLTRPAIRDRTPSSTAAHVDDPHRSPDGAEDRPRLLVLGWIFAMGSLASAGFTTNLMAALHERGVTAASAAMLGSLLGVMQLPGRALVMRGVLSGSPSRLLSIGTGLQGLGLAAVALAPWIAGIAAGTATFALGGGLMTIVRPHVVQTIFASGSGGYLNGRIAKQQQLARAAGPLAIAWLAASIGYRGVFMLLAAAFCVVAAGAKGVLAPVSSASSVIKPWISPAPRSGRAPAERGRSWQTSRKR